LSDNKRRFVRYGIKIWRFEPGNNRSSANYKPFSKNNRRRSRSYRPYFNNNEKRFKNSKTSKLRQRKLYKPYLLRQSNQKPRSHDNPARINLHNLEPAKSALLRSLRVKRFLNTCQITNPSSVLNTDLHSPRIPPSTSTFGDVVVRRIQIRIRRSKKISKKINKKYKKLPVSDPAGLRARLNLALIY
jgi:hypothetical protein